MPCNSRHIKPKHFYLLVKMLGLPSSTYFSHSCVFTVPPKHRLPFSRGCFCSATNVAWSPEPELSLSNSFLFVTFPTVSAFTDVMNDALLFTYFSLLLPFHMLALSTQLDRNLLEQKKHLLYLCTALVCTRIAYRYFFFQAAYAHTPVQISQHSHCLLRENKLTCQFK